MSGGIEQESYAVACGGLPADFFDHLRSASELPGRTFRLLPESVTGDELIAKVARHRPRFALLPDSWLRQESLVLLDGIAAANRTTMMIVVGSIPSGVTLSHALQRGLRGIFTADCRGDQLRKALEVVDSGELWVSRRRLLEVLATRVPPESTAANDTWRNLPALTEREHAVLREILEGKSNKQIARDLELSEHTVKIHLQHIYQKLGVHRRLDLLRAKA